MDESIEKSKSIKLNDSIKSDESSDSSDSNESNKSNDIVDKLESDSENDAKNDPDDDSGDDSGDDSDDDSGDDSEDNSGDDKLESKKYKEPILEKESKKIKNIELHNLFKNNINNMNFDKTIIQDNKNKLNNKYDVKNFMNALELINNKEILENKTQITKTTLPNKILVDNRFDYLYPHLDDKFFNIKINNKQEFNEFKYNIDLNKDTNFELEAYRLCNEEFNLAPHQNFIKNFLSTTTPYNGILLYHGLGSGKTCSAITVAEETRQYNKFNNIDNDIIIVSSPLVQKNFRLQLFDENKLEYKNDKWVINNCAGNNFLDEINLMNIKLSKSKVISLVDNLIKKTYKFKGYIEFANLINTISNIDNVLKTHKLSTKNKNLLIKNKLQKFFDNKLIIVDEIHNIRDSKDNSNKLVAKQFYNLIKNVDNLKLILLSATPMFNDYKEIIFLINILNMNDRRSTVDIKDIFNSDGTFVKTDDNIESGKELLIRKLNGYVSYIKGDNPFIFPYRILPEIFDNSKSIKFKDFIYPINNILGNKIENNSKISIFDIYLNNISKYQEKVYKYIINKLENLNKDTNFKYTELLKPLEALNIVFPNNVIDNFDFDKEDSGLITVNIDDLVGKVALSKLMTYKEYNDKAISYRYNYKYNNSKQENIFLRENISKYSSKIHSILNNIEGSKGPIIIYSQFINSGLIPLALALEGYGFKHYGNIPSLFEDPGCEELDIYSYKKKSKAVQENGKFKGAKYIMITGDKTLSGNKKEELNVCNTIDNINGENIKVILLSSAGSEGLDFKNIRQIHILEPWYNINRIEQILGRGVRTCSHKDLPFNERNVKIYMHGSLLSDTTVETVDLLIYRKAEDKAKQIGIITRIMKEVSIDCHLNYDLTKFDSINIDKILDNNFKLVLSNNEIINYKIGDKVNSAICDYMDSCQYKCYPKLDEYDKLDNDDNNLKTFQETHLETLNSKLINLIRNMFKENYFYSKEDIIKYLYTNNKYSAISINNALYELVNNDNYIIYDKYNRKGRIINIEDLYIYQPTELNNHNSSLYSKSTPFLERRNVIDYQISNIKTGNVQKPDIQDPDKELSKEDDKEEDIKSIITTNDTLLKELIQNYKNIIRNPKKIIDKSNSKFKDVNSGYNLLLDVYNLNNKTNILKIDKVILENIILHILIDNLDLESKIQIYSYVLYNYLTYEENESPDMDEIIKYVISEIKKIIDTNIIEYKSKKALVFPFSSQFKLNESDSKITLYLLEYNDDNKFLKFKSGEQMDYNRFYDKIIEKYKIENANFSDSLGYIKMNFKNNYYDFVIKHKIEEKNDYSNGRLCKNFHTINDKYDKIFSSFMRIDEYKELEKVVIGKRLCIVSEIFLRYFTMIKKDNKIWFYDPNYSILTF
tara:strand:- start:33 stop:4196 length:4164 start_codon:yes stop_codon:yes gene_type:complete